MLIAVVVLILGIAAAATQVPLVSTVAVWLALDSVPRDETVSPFLAVRESDQTFYILVVGNDTRDALPSDDPYWFGSLTGQRADVVMLVAIDQLGDEIRLLSLDRDLRVDTEQYGPLTFSESFGYGGSPLLVRSVAELTGLPVHHYVEVAFDGFARFIDELGGVTIEFCGPSRDLVTGLHVPAGSIELNGEDTLALVRSRAFERHVDGDWVAVEQGSTGRVGRQQLLIGRLLGELREGVGPSRVIALVATAGDLAVVDTRLGSGTLLDMVEVARTGSVTWEVLPAIPVRSQSERLSPFLPAHLGGRLYLQPALEADETLDRFSDGDGSQPVTDPGGSGDGAASDAPLRTVDCA